MYFFFFLFFLDFEHHAGPRAGECALNVIVAISCYVGGLATSYEYSVVHLPLADNPMDKINALIIVINIRLWFPTELEPNLYFLCGMRSPSI